MNRHTSFAALFCALLFNGLALAGPREDFLKLIDHPRVPLDAKLDEPKVENGVAQTHFSFASRSDDRVPGLILKSEKFTGRRPVMIMQHGTGGTFNDEGPFRQKMAGLGFIAVSIDARHHGERSKAGTRGTADYFEGIIRAYKDGSEHPFYYDTCWDLMRLVDYLQARDDVDGSRIGLMGISKGGTETYLTAAIDPRIAVAIPCIGVQSFKYILDNNLWQPRIGTVQAAFNQIAKDEGVEKPDTAFVRKFCDRVLPGVYGEFDGPSMLPLIAPRPLLVINGELDERNPLPGLKLCTDAAMEAYKAKNAQDRFVVLIEPNTPHRVTPEAHDTAAEFFVKWLKP